MQRARSIWPWLVLILLLLALSAATLLWGPWLREGVWTSGRILTLFTAANVLAGGVYVWVLWSRRNQDGTRGLAGILFAGVLIRALLLPSLPIWETDYYRYLWDGAQVAHGLNPYTLSPEEAVHALDTGQVLPGDRHLIAQGQDQWLRSINHPSLRTIYPPVAQLAFGLSSLLSPFDVTVWRAILLLADLLTAGLLLLLLRQLGLPLLWVAFYWLNPLLLKEFYSSAHLDALLLPTIVAAVLLAVRGRPILATAAITLGFGVKFWPIVLVPLLLTGVRLRTKLAALAVVLIGAAILLLPMLSAGPLAFSSVGAYADRWQANDGLFQVINILWRSALAPFSGLALQSGVFARITAVVLLVLWMLWLIQRMRRGAMDLPHAALLTIAGVFIPSPTQYPWYYTWILPLLAVRPHLSLLLYTALLPLYHLSYTVPMLVILEHVPVCWLLACEVAELRRKGAAAAPLPAEPGKLRVAVIIPALNEQQAIASVLQDLPAWVAQVIVVDNGSTDQTPQIARASGAQVVTEPRRGYGQACLAGIAALRPCGVVVFLDADYSDRPSEIGSLLAPIARGDADLVIGSRVLGQRERGALSIQQRLGNALACGLLRLFGARFTDLGPFRAIRYTALIGLRLDHATYGWTVQMQARACRLGLRCVEVPVSYHRRRGKSKISGTLRGIWGAGTCILGTIGKEMFRKPRYAHRVVIMARAPEPGRTKTRLIPALGPHGAASLHRQMVHIALGRAKQAAAQAAAEIELRMTGGSGSELLCRTGAHVHKLTDQGDGDLGDRISRAFDEAFAAGMTRVVLIGTDCPGLSDDDLAAAIGALEENDLVLGPSFDGGYYLIGLRRPARGLFRSIDWGTSVVREQTLNAANCEGLKTYMLPPRSDIDTGEDLHSLLQHEVVRTPQLPLISVVIPTLNEEAQISAAIASASTAPNIEVIVADGGSSDRTTEIAANCGAQVIISRPSRGIQQRCGASAARGEILLFLHADTRLPVDWADHVRSHCAVHPEAAGAFRLRLDVSDWRYRLMEQVVQLRSDWLQLPYGDQALFMSAAVYHAAGGFPAIPFMEDYALVRTLSARKRIRLVGAHVVTSARKWQESGILRTTLGYQARIVRYLLRGHKGSAAP